jgi:N-methylhydantoinase B/oxoprolinase/acetone carboxylase alpha subunit
MRYQESEWFNKAAVKAIPSVHDDKPKTPEQINLDLRTAVANCERMKAEAEALARRVVNGDSIGTSY